jgi:outer membrane protein OmpA-like peptidoglycan-associated protein/tetratricopeptide (TPR) repeat protein
MKKRLLYVIILIFVSLLVEYSPACAQKIYSTKSKKAIKLYEESEHYMARRQYIEVINILNLALERDNEFTEAHLRIAFCYKLLNNVEAQKSHLEEVLEYTDAPARYINTYFSLGEAYFLTQEYDKAARTLNDFLKVQGINRRLIPEAEWLLKNIYFAKDAILKPLEIEPVMLPATINAGPLQYFPVLTGDEEKIFFTKRQGAHPRYDENIFVSERDEQGNWTKPVSLSANINTASNEGTCTISADGKVLIFTSCQGQISMGGCDLYISYREGNDWSRPVNLGPEVNSRHWDSQPSLSADGRKLYFVSERPGGIGSRDIWVSYRDEENEWQQAVNPGTAINTERDEVSPFIHVNGQTLYFASKGYPGFGGYDLYSVEYINGEWTRPKNLGWPVNTPQDQISLFVTSDGSRAYYSLDSYDPAGLPMSMIYTFDIPDEITVSNRSFYVKGTIRDEETRTLLKARVELRDVNKNELISIVSSDSVFGEYIMILTEGSEYALYVEHPGYILESRNFNLPRGSENKPVVMDFFLKKSETGAVTTLNNIFFETDSYALLDRSITELEKVVEYLNTYPGLKIEISGHTDDVGTARYNQQLSLKRAEAVFTYLTEQGLADDRLSYKGYGQEQPAFPNNSDDNRSKNRRIEFKILQ